MDRLRRVGLKRLLFLLIGIAILATSLTFFVQNFNKPYMGIELSNGPQGWAVSYVDPTGLAESYGVKVGDIPVEINGRPAQIFLEKYAVPGTALDSLINQLTVVDAAGQSKS